MPLGYKGAGRRKRMSKKVVMNSNFLKSHTYCGGVLEIVGLPILEAIVWRTSEDIMGMQNRVRRGCQCAE